MNIEDGVVQEKEGGTDGTQAAEDQTNLNPDLEQGNESPVDGGAENPTDGEATGEVEGQPQPEGEVAKPDPLLEINKVIEDKFKALEEKIKPAESPPRQLSEEEWAKQESEWGVPRTAIQKQINLAIRVKQEMKEYVDAQLAELHKDSIMADVAKQNGISDYKRLDPGIKEFLSAFDPKSHSNPELLKRAMFYARGKSAPQDVRKIQSNDEKNRQVVNRLKTGKPDVRPSSNGPSKGLTESQREAAEMIGLDEYNRIKNNKSKVIAV